uniref:type II toxin-antitoxin system VapC family toxin n=1 Tax=uncultured Caulobacter sp. TaxID=158749 RepID=UPI0025F18A04|nr:type II toxin-antitoxin system VapC family toxin [uncultured Caulobacter sp.]
MVIDTSVMIAIQFAEPESTALTVAILASETRLMSAASYVEYVAVLARRFPGFAAADWVERAVAGLRIKVVDVTAAHALLAAGALERYGRARHPAGLNYGDSFAYALAKATGEPLLFKGDDFARTDVVAAAY